MLRERDPRHAIPPAAATHGALLKNEQMFIYLSASPSSA